MKLKILAEKIGSMVHSFIMHGYVKGVAELSTKNSQESSASSQEQLAAMEEVSSSAEDLATLSEELQKLISHFTLRDDK